MLEGGVLVLRGRYEIRVLGPIDVVTPQGVCTVGGERARRVLATLVMAVNHVVSLDHLVGLAWGEDPPPSARATIRVYLSRLRALLGRDAITRHDHGYLLAATEDELDELRFMRLVTRADHHRADPARCRALCQEALALWRGVPFGDLSDVDPFRLEAMRLDELRMATMELRLASDLALGHTAEVIGSAYGAVEEHPYRERLWFLLVEALVREGRRVEALRACAALRSALTDAGLPPPADLPSLERAILGHEEATEAGRR